MKNILPLLAIMAVMGLFLGAVQPANAATSELQLADWHGDPLSVEELTVTQGHGVGLKARLLVDGDPKGYRWIHLYVYDEDGDQTGTAEKFTFPSVGGSGGGGEFSFLTNWYPETYRIHFTYWGSPDGKWPRADKEVLLHVTR